MSSAIISSSAARRIALPAQDQDVATLRRAIVAKLTYSVGSDPIVATERDWFVATALATRDHIVERWMPTTRSNYADNRKRVYYLSLEFLIGRLLKDSLTNLGLVDQARLALAELGVDFDRLCSAEPDAALGNGGLGRLAACFMESMATLGIAAYGYGIRYANGLFRQVIRDGCQFEYPEEWLSFGNPWEFERPDASYEIGFGGFVETAYGADGAQRHIWHPGEKVNAVAYDTPMVGWRGRHVNTLRLWSSRAEDPLRLDVFNAGDYVGALAARSRANAISQILYPSDGTPSGQELRLRQEFFLSSASLQDLMRRHMNQHRDVRLLPDKAAIQLNDTHPAIVVPELMRMLTDGHGLTWDDAWDITTRTVSYTNHTLLPEALETWPVQLMERLLPRHMQIIFRINEMLMDSLRGRADAPPLSSVSLIGDGRIRMGNLAFIGSHKVNGVSALHTSLMRETVFHDLHRIFPDRITNKTNGITFRRWLFGANPRLTALLAEVAGPRVLDDPSALESLASCADDASLHDRLAAVRLANKTELASLIADRVGVKVDPAAMFDVHIKRIHEYKRQLLNILETVALASAMRANPHLDWVPRVKIFAGKAAAGYHHAKLIIQLINVVARVVNGDPALRGLLKVVFLPDYNASLAEAIIPAADLSEQISTAGMEASGTGNMKLALNGALTIGTLDGANVEIMERVGAGNIFIFGLAAEQVARRRRHGPGPQETIAGTPMLREVLEAVGTGVFSHGESGRFRPLTDDLSEHDHFLVTADFEAYASAQRQVDARWLDKPAWWRSSVLNIANMGWFSSDRAIGEYAAEIWNVPL